MLLQGEGVSAHIGRGVIESLAGLGIDWLAQVCGEARVSQGEELSDEFRRDGVTVEEPGEDRRKRVMRSVASHSGRGRKRPSDVKPPLVASRQRRLPKLVAVASL